MNPTHMKTEPHPALLRAAEALTPTECDYWETEVTEEFLAARIRDAAETIDKETGFTDLLAALKDCADMIDVAFEYDGDVFGHQHNNAADAIQAARLLIAKASTP